MFKCRHNMKLRTLLEHEAGAPPPVWAASAGPTGGLADGDAALTGAPLWELALLHRHYHPSLAKAAAAVAVIPPQGGHCYETVSVLQILRPAQSIHSIHSSSHGIHCYPGHNHAALAEAAAAVMVFHPRGACSQYTFQLSCA